MRKAQFNKLPLKKVYYLVFSFFIVLPILIIFIVALNWLNWEFREQAIHNIEQAQETIRTELMADINTMSMKLSHLIYTNDNEVINYVSKMDTLDLVERYHYEQKLNQASSLALEPTKNIISLGFHMKNGKNIYVKNPIKRTDIELKETEWYKEALENPNTVHLGAYDTAYMNDLFTGGKKDLFILVYALSPNVVIDRSQKIEMITMYQSVSAGERIRQYNNQYLEGQNKLGVTLIRDQNGEIIFSTIEGDTYKEDQKNVLCITSPIFYNNTTWYIESYIQTSHLMGDYWEKAFIILGVAIIILALVGYCLSYFLKSIVRPIEEMSTALKTVEEGNLDIHILPSGQHELRTMIHSFNAMVRRLKALIDEYEDKIRNTEKTPQDYFELLLKEEISVAEAKSKCKELFSDGFIIIGLWLEGAHHQENESDSREKLICHFQKNPRFSSRCLVYAQTPSFFLVFYSVREEGDKGNIKQMLGELQHSSMKQFNIQITACVGALQAESTQFEEAVDVIKKQMCLRYLKGNQGIIDLEEDKEQLEEILELSKNYLQLANALYIADEKNMVEEREKLFEQFAKKDETHAINHVLAAVLAIGMQSSIHHFSFIDIFGQRYDYIEKLKRIEDIRQLKLWVTNYFEWIMDYSASKLNICETDIIIKAKRYMIDHFDDSELCLAKVAEYVGLNEKYFANRFSKEAGETFLTYLTGIRMQKSKEMLRTIQFKVYEIAEMVGYHNVEHFNRVFKKINDITPAQYRKTM